MKNSQVGQKTKLNENQQTNIAGQLCIEHQARISPDINDFKRAMATYCKDIVNRRNQDSSTNRTIFKH